MQRVERENVRDEGARPEGAGRREHGQQQQRGQRVKEHVGKVMPAALPAEELVGDHVRKAGQRQPVHVIAGGQRPIDSVQREAGAHVVIADDFRVVEIDEVERRTWKYARNVAAKRQR